jgi:hypothetical protein
MDNRKGMHMTELGIYANTACIIGEGHVHNTGYTVLYVNGKQIGGHRYAWQEVHGPIPEGMYVCHRCDNRPCVNVDHLFLGNASDNNRDMALKGRNWQQQKTHCPQGHPYDMIKSKKSWSGVQRRCSICKNNEARLYRARKKAARGI